MKKRFIICLSCFLICGCNKKIEKKDNDVVNIYDDVIKNQIVENIGFNNPTVIFSKGVTNFRVIMKNNGDAKEINNVIIKFKSSNDIIMEEFKIPVMKIIKNNEEKVLTMSTDIDLTNAYKIIYELD